MSDGPSNSFHTTRWTQVVAARGSTPEAKQALRELCETYYGPVELFVRRYRGGADDARDLTHEFFAKLLEADSLGNVDRTRGRFRSYLLGAVKHFLADQDDRAKALKRGGREQPQSLSNSPFGNNTDDPNAEAEAVPDPHGFPPDAFFDRHWAIAVVEQAIGVLRREATANSDLARFDVLQRWLVAPSGHDTAVEAARSLHMTDSAFKVAVHRLRKQFRRAVTDRISETVNDSTEIQDELHYLLTALTAPTVLR